MNNLKVNEIYKSLQGESSFTGIPFGFVRLTGCKLRCSYCDTDYAFVEGNEISLDDILAKIFSFKVEHVLLTGGEPLDQPSSKILIERLLDKGYIVLVETGGYHSIKDMPRRAHFIVDIKTPSSKMQHRNYPNIIQEIMPHDEIKFVIGTREDYVFAKEMVRTHKLDTRCTVLFSPVFNQIAYSLLAGWILEDNLNVRFQLQTHKHIWPSEKRGV